MKKYLLLVCLVGACMLSACSAKGQQKSSETSENAVTIRVSVIQEIENPLKKAIADYEKEHPNVTIQLKENTEYSDVELKRAQLFSELSSGDGPDVIYCDRTSMGYFADKGCLMELSNVLTEETKQSYLASVLKSGEHAGGFYLLPTHLNLSAIYVNPEVFDGEEWSISQVLEIIKAKEQSGSPFEDIWLLYEGHSTPGEILRYFFLEDIIHSELIDLENSFGDFQSELFHEVLEVCKKYGEQEDRNVPSTREDRARSIQEQKLLCFSEPLINFSKFSTLGRLMDENTNLVGVPTLSASGLQLTGVTGIAVNKETKHKEEVLDFLDCLFNQQYFETNPVDQIPTRKDCLEGKVQTDADWTDDVVVWTSATMSVKVPGKANGDSFEKEYMDFLNHCIPYDERNDYIINIIVEEAEPYFTGEKDLDTVCKLVQNRVQLYLDE